MGPVTGPCVVDWAVAGGPIAGELESGDLHVVAPFPGGVLVCAIDGLGHGTEAALAARAAAAVLEADPQESLVRLVEQCHASLRTTRGAVMTLATFHAGRAELTWMGVGNVEGVLLRADPTRPIEGAPVRPGVVGFRLPPFREATLPLFPGDTLLLATDGIHGGFARGRTTESSPVELAEAIFAEHRKPKDDALIVVARYIGGSP
jgi:phosphoserine phosphatase RsbX